MIPVSLLATLAVGFALGLRHALDPDHIVAVSTLVAQERGFWRSSRIGAVWGLGHTVTLLVMGLLIVGLGLRVSPNMEHWLEFAVAAMLIFLGGRTLWQWLNQRRTKPLPHTGHVHWDGHSGDTLTVSHPHGEGSARQSFLIGIVHGLSGSAELMLLVLATIRQPVWALVYVGIFGLGMMLAMFALTALFSMVFNWTRQKPNGLWHQFHGALCVLTGVASAGLGLRLLWVW